jgi:hypothetical protein
MNEIAEITAVEVRDGFAIRLTFYDGAIKDVDLSDFIADSTGVFAPLRERHEIFEAVRVNRETGAVEWPGEVDLDPDILYGPFEPASGPPLQPKTIREPTPASR